MKKNIISLIEKFYKKEGRMPSYSEASKIFGLSKAGAFKSLNKLVRENFLKKSSSGLLVPGERFGNFLEDISEIKVLGLVEAGFPTPAEQNELDRTTLDEYLVGNREATFMLKVKGDSMQEAGILEGDMVLVERTDSTKPGQIVIAEVDGSWTMKYLRMGKAGLYLEPANKKYKPIFPKEELKISAVVTAVLRKYPS